MEWLKNMGNDLSKIRVFVAMSGGVDSSVAAYLLKKEGYNVTGVYMKNWSDPLSDECPWREDIKDFRKVCKILNIPARLEIFEEEYRSKVVKYLISGYKKGITPNPDMLCNSEIKFKLFLDKAKSLGADFIATGHYVIKKEVKGVYNLYQAKDNNKDQSYFLALLNQRQLKDAIFPIGIYPKAEIRKIAKKAKLSVHDKKDSQGICFIGKVKFSDFIRDFIPSKIGNIITTNGKIVGKHDGVAYYTIGQRHGLKIGGGIPYFVVEKNKRKNQLVVAKGSKNKQLFKGTLKVSSFNWISNEKIKFPIFCDARIRYRQPLQKCKVTKRKNKYLVTFSKLQRAITPGQFVVLYKRNKMMGGGIII